MKKLILSLLVLATAGTIAMAQCDKKVSFISSKTEHLDDKGTVQDSQDETTTVEFSKTGISVYTANDNGDQKMTGDVKSFTCDWSVPFKTGKTTMSVTLKRDNGDTRDFNLVIEGKDGKITLVAVSPEQAERQIRLTADKFEEAK
ncbi:hypothetical protein [Mucilaginibacter ginsenosidivorans]|uniref:Lipocalin-like domain-containing protein n=1 Tax=Mucilaginibacter ginsenosidivorans TaxID=398053 RepID=A0A5B8UY56_9SPHI|nr:hypothetical protein [Mucilaginibacter ginsenosidivorans]QEC63929.1 hypothetical protein FRZ54_15545 [Mucilaginibacter ginsenosidivorans]